MYASRLEVVAGSFWIYELAYHLSHKLSCLADPASAPISDDLLGKYIRHITHVHFIIHFFFAFFFLYCFLPSNRPRRLAITNPSSLQLRLRRITCLSAIKLLQARKLRHFPMCCCCWCSPVHLPSNTAAKTTTTVISRRLRPFVLSSLLIFRPGGDASKGSISFHSFTAKKKERDIPKWPEACFKRPPQSQQRQH